MKRSKRFYLKSVCSYRDQGFALSRDELNSGMTEY